jgi:hypothetical protein
MHQLSSTIPGPQRGELPVGDRATRQARAWVLHRLRWEHRLAELRAEHVRART